MVYYDTVMMDEFLYHIYTFLFCNVIVDNEDRAIAVSEPDELEDFSDYDDRELKSYPLVDDEEEALFEDDLDDEEEDYGVEDTGGTRQLRGGCGSGRTRFRGRCVR